MNIKECDVKIVNLMFDENSLKNRTLKDIANGIRNEEIIFRSIKRLSLYEKIVSIKINTSNKKIEEVVKEILLLK